jgi:hypothetical protein
VARPTSCPLNCGFPTLGISLWDVLGFLGRRLAGGCKNEKQQSADDRIPPLW